MEWISLKKRTAVVAGDAEDTVPISSSDLFLEELVAGDTGICGDVVLRYVCIKPVQIKISRDDEECDKTDKD
ncbi:hypothetical protein [Granulicella paludicola]|uniref:hypothetical protein n=1 Tax=Granulicella paludicola TaxID=474951 RepID=UPI0021E02A45|nr:hypothetical protein [Granulicella paludicola]